MSEWIPIAERFPELPAGGGKHFVIAFAPTLVTRSSLMGSIFAYWNGREFRHVDGKRCDYRLTHWMPVPFPPDDICPF